MQSKRQLHILGLTEEQVASIGTEPYESLSRFEVRSQVTGRVIERAVAVGETAADPLRLPHMDEFLQPKTAGSMVRKGPFARFWWAAAIGSTGDWITIFSALRLEDGAFTWEDWSSGVGVDADETAAPVFGGHGDEPR